MTKTAKGAVEKPRQSRKSGRPRKVTNIVERAKKYRDGEYEIEGDAVPTAAGLACYLGVARSRIYAWAEENPDFQDMLDTIQSKQERMLVNRGLTGDFNAAITKLMLAKHGYSDKSEIDNKSSDGSMTPKAIDASSLSDAALKELMNARCAKSNE